MRGISPKKSKCKLKSVISGEEWSPKTVYNLLRNPAYNGIREINRANKNKPDEDLKAWQKHQSVKAAWPRIVDELTFNRSQKMLDDTETQDRSRLQGAQKRDYVLTGLTYCKDCGRRLMGGSATGRSEVHRYYVHHQPSGSKVVCPVKRHRAGEIEELVQNHLMNELSQEKFLKGLTDDFSRLSQLEIGSLERKRKGLREMLSVIEEESLCAIRSNTGLDPNAANMVRSILGKLSAQKIEIERKILSAENEIYDHRDSLISEVELQETIAEVRRGYSKAPLALKKRLLKRVFKRLELSDSGIGIFYQQVQNQNDAGSGVYKKSSTPGPFLTSTSSFQIHGIAPKRSAGCEEVIGSLIMKDGRPDRI